LRLFKYLGGKDKVQALYSKREDYCCITTMRRAMRRFVYHYCRCWTI